MDSSSISKDAATLHHIVEEAYDSIAPTYHSLFSLHPTPTRIRHIQALAEMLHPGAQVLELGCGGGLGTQPFVARGCQITGVDISVAQIALAREHIPDAVLMHGDMLSVDFQPAAFDAVVAMYCLMHVAKEEQQLMLARIGRWLKPGGYLLCNLPGGQDAEASVGKWLGAEMFFEALGVEGNRNMFREHARELRIIQDEVVVDKFDSVASKAVGEADETFHWILAIKETSGEV